MTTLQTQAKQAAAKQVHLEWAKLKEIAAKIVGSKIEAANTIRSIGTNLQEMSGHSQLAFGYYQESMMPQLPADMTYEHAKKCVKAANAITAEIKTIEDANRLEVSILEVTEFMEEAKRLSQHTSRDMDPGTFFYNKFSDLKEVISKKIAAAKEWDEDTRAEVLSQIARAEKWIAELREAIQ